MKEHKAMKNIQQTKHALEKYGSRNEVLHRQVGR